MTMHTPEPTAQSQGPITTTTTTAPPTTDVIQPPPPPELVTQNDEDALRKALDTYQLPATGPACWGPLQWMALHQMLRGYPVSSPSEEKQAALRQYVAAMAEVIPCSKCSYHWKQLAPTVKTGSRFEALKWSIDAHNTVNQRLHKPLLTYADAVANMNERCAGNVLQQVGASASAAGAKAGGGGGCTSASSSNQALIIGLSCGLAVFGALAIALLIYFVLMRGRGRSAATKFR